MKKTLLILSLFIFSFSNGQTLPFEIIGITGNLGNPSSGQIDGEVSRNYERFGAVSSFEQVSSGPNQSWDISGLTGLQTILCSTTTRNRQRMNYYFILELIW